MSGHTNQENDGFNTDLEGGLKTKESPRQSQAWGRSGEGPQALGGTRVADGRSPHSTCERQIGAPPGPGAEICKDPAAGKGLGRVSWGDMSPRGSKTGVCLGAAQDTFIYLFSPPNTSSMFPQYKDSPFHDHSSTFEIGTLTSHLQTLFRSCLLSQ